MVWNWFVMLAFDKENLKFDNSKDFAKKPQRSCSFMNSSSVADVPRPRKTTSPGLLTFVPQVHNFQSD